MMHHFSSTSIMCLRNSRYHCHRSISVHLAKILKEKEEEVVVEVERVGREESVDGAKMS